MRRSNAFYEYCTCPGFRFQKTVLDQRRCKHLSRTLPAEKFDYAAKPSLILLNVITPRHDVRDMWYSEKLDGVRGYWTGTHFVSRRGRIIHAVPLEIQRRMPPDVGVDGEFYAGPQSRDQVVSVLLASTQRGRQWYRQLGVDFVAFDLNTNQPYSVRYRELKRLGQKHNFTVIPQHACESETAVVEKLRQVLQHNGEGLVIRSPVLDQGYVGGRNANVLKLKKACQLVGRPLEEKKHQ